ncbi:hypothetical protein H7R52_03695 [Weissella confusa]|uniref:ATP:glycerol 3-phosphotransferase n=1 Tax=Weissella confusa TaxID=1583 RepID=A0A923NG11_WEICO|nr:hypothetical protein [Weissella confusa]
MKATLQSIAYQTADILAIMKAESKYDVVKMKADGTVSRNPYLMQFQADIANIEIERSIDRAIFSAGSAVQWLHDRLGLIETQLDAWQLAEQSQNNDEVYVVPAFNGLGAPYWDPQVRGAVFGMTRPVASVIGDQNASLVGQLALEPGTIKNTYGAGAFLLMNTGKEPVTSQNQLVTTIAYQVGDEPTYALEELTDGETHATDASNASRTMLYNIHTQAWDAELLQLFNIPASMLPTVHTSSEVIAQTNPMQFFGGRVAQSQSIADALNNAGHAEMIREKTGLPISAYFSATKIRWILDHVAGAQERAEAGELVFGTVDTWLLWSHTGWLEQRPMDIWRTAQTAIADALINAGIRGDEVKAIGIANQRETTIIWDRQTGQPIYNAISWSSEHILTTCYTKRG